MPRIRRIQSSFNSGVLDPRLAARIDLKAYYAGAEKMDNAICLPQGGASRRDGLKYLDEIGNISTLVTGQTITAPNGGVTADANDDDEATTFGTTTNISTIDPYVAVHYDLGTAKTIEFADIVGAKLSLGGSSEFFIQYSTDDITFTSVGDALPLTTLDYTERKRPRISARYWRVARIGSTDLGANKILFDEFNLWQESTVSDARLIPFSFNTEQTYMLVATDKNIAVYKNDVYLVDIRTPYTSAQLSGINWTQSADTLILVHKDVAPRTLVRDSSDDTTWTLSTITLTNIPQYDYNDASSPSAVNEVQQVNLDNGWAGGETFTLTLNTSTTTTLTNNASTATTATIIQNALRALSNTSDDGITVAYSGATNDYDVTFAGDDGGIDWPEMTGNIISGGGAISVTTTTEGVAAAEDTWSATRGWPNTVTFYEGRMIFGGSKSRPQGIWMSVTNDFFNFDVGTGLPDEAIVAVLDTDQVNEIRAIVPGRRLEIYTSGGEFIVTSTPSIPETFSVARQTSYGTANVRTASIDGATLYVQRNGQSFREFLYSFGEDAHVSNSMSQLSTHLINTPVDLDAARGTATTDTNYVYLVNASGDVVVLNTLREQQIAAWSGPWTTGATGLFKRVGVLDTDAYFIIQRTINGSTVNYLEKLDSSYLTDSGYQIASHSSATVTGLSHLEGETVKVKIGGAMQPDAVVTGGQITLARTPSAELVEVGLGYNPTIKTMPVSSDFQDGPTLNREKRIVRCTINSYLTLGIFVNGERIPDRQLDIDTFDDVPDPASKTTEIYLHGWSQKAQVTITQTDSTPMTILALDLEVSA